MLESAAEMPSTVFLLQVKARIPPFPSPPPGPAYEVELLYMQWRVVVEDNLVRYLAE